MSDWAARSSLKLNNIKTKAISLGSAKIGNSLYSADLFAIRMPDGEYVPCSDTITSLRIVLDSQLSWKPHIDAITIKFE